MQQQMNNKPKTLNLLQLFRGLAAIAVALFHVDQLTNEKFNAIYFFDIFKFGWSGVDYFLVLSGFIIIYTQHKNLLQRSFTRFKSFLLKRFVRIYPIYWLATLGILLFLLLIPGFKNNTPLTLSSTIQSFLLFPQQQAPILNVGWTLILILFFYLIFSLNYILPRRLYLFIIAIVLLGSTSQFISAFAISPAEYPRLGLVFNSLNLEFLFGCIAAYLVLNYSLHYRKTIFFLGLGSLLLFSYLQTYGVINEVNIINLFGIDFTINRTIFSGIPCFFLVMGAASIDIKNGVEIPKIFTYLGDASYSIYLIHSPVISALVQLCLKLKLNEAINNYFILGSLIAIISIGFSCIFYNLIEKPLTKYLRKQLIPRKTSPS